MTAETHAPPVAHDAEPPASSRTSMGLDVAGVLLTLLAGWLLGTGRWGSYVSPSGGRFFLTDAVLAVVVLACAVWWRSVVTRLTGAVTDPLAWALLAFLAWCAVRFAVGHRADHDALRDFAPYLYAGVAVLTIATRAWERVRSWHVGLVLMAHGLWVHYSATILQHYAVPVLGPIRMFTLRSDFDAYVCGCGAVFALLQVVRAKHVVFQLVWGVVALSNAYLLMTQQNRAALLATVVMALAVTPRLVIDAVSWVRRRGALAGAVLAVATVALVAVALPVSANSATGKRVQASFKGGQQATGTIDARREVYRLVIDYVEATPSRTAFGVGFGPDFLAITGAAKYYETTYDHVRAPHDALVNTFARAGLVGAALQLVLFLFAAWRGLVTLHRRTPSPVTQLAALLALGLPVVALFGVILESPFGAIPYFWALGTLIAAREPVPSS